MFQKRGQLQVKGFFARHRLWIAITSLIGTIIGAGILGLPYVISQVGLFYGAILIVLLGLAFLGINLFLGEIVLRTNGKHQLTGYAEKYLGPKGKKIMAFSMLIGIYGALIAYLIGEGAALHAIFKFGDPIYFSLIFFIFGVFIVMKGVKATGKAELILIGLLFLVILAIGLLSLNKINLTNFSTHDLAKLLIPYGVIVFAYGAGPVIPELKEELGNEKKKLKKAIIIGSCIPIFLYLIFTVVIMGLVGLPQFQALEPNQRIATVALSIYANPLLGFMANFLAVLAMFTSFLSLSLALVEMYRYDYGLSNRWSYFLTFVFPLMVLLLGLTTFMAALDITGAVAGGLGGTLYVLMYWKAKTKGDRKPEYSLNIPRVIGYLLIAMFISGIVHELWVKLL